MNYDGRTLKSEPSDCLAGESLQERYHPRKELVVVVAVSVVLRSTMTSLEVRSPERWRHRRAGWTVQLQGWSL